MKLIISSIFEAAQRLTTELMNYADRLKKEEPAPGPGMEVTKEYFEIVKEFGDKLVDFMKRIKNDKQFIEAIYQSPSVKQQPFNSSDELIHAFFILDLMKCLNLTAGSLNLKNKEVFVLLYIMAKEKGIDVDNLSKIHLLNEPKLLSAYENMRRSLQTEIENISDNDSTFNIALMLSIYDEDLQREYLSNLYRFASIVAKADGVVTKEEEAALKRIMNLTKQHAVPRSKTDAENIHAKVHPPSKKTLEEVMAELNALIGLQTVKEEINTLINFIKVQKAREASGLKASSLSYHLVFTGNPGTGKTTVARLVSEIYKHLGVLKQGQLIETDRSGLVAGYLGQTAGKVNKIVDAALNGTLFIDEAYSLLGENRDDYGREAVSILVKRIEDDRDKLVVILAGYPNEMKIFIDTNPGLRSRFNRYIEFRDYTADELLAIYKLQCSKLDYSLTPDAEEKLGDLFSIAVEKKDESFGNGRFARNMFEKTLEKQANRIAAIPTLTKEILITITEDDIPEPVQSAPAKSE